MARISDANIVLTDKLMESVYAGEVVDSRSVVLLKHEGIATLNIMAPLDRLFSLLAPLKAKPFMICGSSNFHHLDACNLTLHREAAGMPMQLILVDRHMDCQKFREESRTLHCGNWVSYAYRKGLIDRVAMVGCDDFSRLSSFDNLMREEGKWLYQPDFRSVNLVPFLDPARPVYISIDTDVLDVPSDWGRGRHSLDTVLQSSLWDQLADFRVTGAFLNGHVTDGRRLADAFAFSLRSEPGGLTGLGPRELLIDAAITFKDKLVASLAGAPLPPREQLSIMAAFHARVLGAMSASPARLAPS